MYPKIVWPRVSFVTLAALVHKTFLHCACPNVPSNCLSERKHCHTGCICKTFLHGAFSNVSSKRQPEKRHSHIYCICLTLLHGGFLNVSSNGLSVRMKSHTGCISFWMNRIFSFFPVHCSASFSISSQRECILLWPDCMLPSSLQRSSSITIQVVLFLGPNSVFKLRGTFNVSLLFQGKENSESAYKAAIIPNDPASTNWKFRCNLLHLDQCQ